MSEEKEEYRTNNKMGHGGRRVAGEGKKIGRPLLGENVKRKAMTFKLPKVLADKLKAEENQTGLLVKLLADYYGVNLKDLETG